MASRAFAMISIDTKFVMHCTRGFSSLSFLSRTSVELLSRQSSNLAIIDPFPLKATSRGVQSCRAS